MTSRPPSQTFRLLSIAALSLAAFVGCNGPKVAVQRGNGRR